MRYLPLDIIQEIIEATPRVTSLLGATKGFPNVAQELIPEGMKRPYILLREEADGMGENDLLGTALVSADVFVEGDKRLAVEIGNELEKLFHNQRYMNNGDNVGAGAVTSFIKFRHSPPQPDPSVKCRNVKILLNYCRDDLLEL